MTQLAVEAAISGAPAQWQRRRLRSVAIRREDRVGARDLELLSLESIGRLVPRLADRQAPAESSVPRYLEAGPGDLVINPMWLTGGSIAVSDRAGAVSPDYRVFHLGSDVEPRFLHHLLRSAPYIEQYRLFARADTTFDRRIQQGDIDNLALAMPPLEEQRRIADFLDDHVSQIDAAVQLREEQLAHVPDLLIARAGALLAPFRPDGPPLGVVSKIVDTEHKTAPTVLAGGHWIAGTSALRGGRLDHGALRETDAESYGAWTRRGAPSAGDVLLSREAPVGEVALLEDSDPAVAIGQRVVLLKPHRHRLSGGFLRLVLMSPVLQRVIADTTVGSLHPHLNMADISRLRVPAVDLATQNGLAEEHASQLSDRDQARTLLRRSVMILGEYKQSLITAAVTGQIDVSAASGRSIPA